MKLQRFVKQKSAFAINGVSDILGYFKERGLAIEVKTVKDYNYVMKHYEELKKYVGLDKKKTHLREQIWFIEKVRANGGTAFFACSLEMVEKMLFPEGAI